MTQRMFVWLGILALLGSACAPAEKATPTPTPVPAQAAVATSTPTLPPGVTPGAPTPIPLATPTTAPPAGPQYGGILRLGVFSDPAAWDPFRRTSSDLADVINPVHSKLFFRNISKPGCDTWPMDPELATRFEWVDDRSIDIYLREGVRYQDKPPMNGRELVADDVVYSITKQWRKTRLVSSMTPYVEAVEAVGKYKVRMRTTIPYAALPDVAFPEYYAYIMGKEVFGPTDTFQGPEGNVGLGPFMFKSYVPGVSVELEKNPNYWREGVPYVDGLKMYIMPDLSSQIAALRSGKLDHVYFRGNAATVDDVRRMSPQIQAFECPMEPPFGVYLRSDKPPFDDVRVRRAVSMAVDREGILKTVYFGRASPVYTTVLPHLPGYMKKDEFPSELRKYLERNPAEAKKLLAEAGYPNGLETTIAVTTRFPDQPKVAEAIAGNLADIGIRAKLDIREYARMTESMTPPSRYDGMAVYWYSHGADLVTVLKTTFYTGDPYGNRAYISDKKMDSLIDEYMATRDPARAAAIVREHQFRQVEMAWQIPMPLANEVGLAQPWVKNFRFKPLPKDSRLYFMFLWLEK